jgi:hypothetical protein
MTDDLNSWTSSSPAKRGSEHPYADPLGERALDWDRRRPLSRRVQRPERKSERDRVPVCGQSIERVVRQADNARVPASTQANTAHRDHTVTRGLEEPERVYAEIVLGSRQHRDLPIGEWTIRNRRRFCIGAEYEIDRISSLAPSICVRCCGIYSIVTDPDSLVGLGL